MKKEIHDQAFQVAEKIMQQIRVTKKHICPKKNNAGLVWIQTYPEVCTALEIKDIDCSEAYSDNGNREQYEERGQLLSLIIFAINHKDNTDGFFWIRFDFFANQRVKLHVDATDLHSQYCNELLQRLTGFEEHHVFTHEEAITLSAEIYQKLKKYRLCYQKIWQEYWV